MNTEPELPSIPSLKGVKLTPKFIERFESKINKDGPTQPHCPEIGPCWLWTGLRLQKKESDGTIRLRYGRIQAESPLRKTLYTHRVAYELYVGPIPDKLMVLHRCDNECCVRGEHLFVGTGLENIADKVSKGRAASGDSITKNKKLILKGSQIGTSKATEDMVVSIRNDYTLGVTRAELAVKYALSWNTIDNIVRHHTWCHV